jgi:hypothetical protein
VTVNIDDMLMMLAVDTGAGIKIVNIGIYID